MSVNLKKPPSPQTLGKHFPGMLEVVAITMGNVTSIEVVADALLWVDEVTGG